MEELAAAYNTLTTKNFKPPKGDNPGKGGTRLEDKSEGGTAADRHTRPARAEGTGIFPKA
ncbi:MAG: hypothetical protein ACLUOI_31695 [Eisenbergiella sp.]